MPNTTHGPQIIAGGKSIPVKNVSLLGPDGKPLSAGDIKAGYTYVFDGNGLVMGHTGHNRKQRRASAAKAKTRHDLT